MHLTVGETRSLLGKMHWSQSQWMKKLSEKQKMQKKHVHSFIISQWGERFSKWRPRQNHEQLGLFLCPGDVTCQKRRVQLALWEL